MTNITADFRLKLTKQMYTEEKNEQMYTLKEIDEPLKINSKAYLTSELPINTR